jgi:hypothetical protein
VAQAFNVAFEVWEVWDDGIHTLIFVTKKWWKTKRYLVTQRIVNTSSSDCFRTWKKENKRLNRLKLFQW